MNKRVVSLLFVTPFVLASCHGQAISRDEALKILGRIEENINKKSTFDVFTFMINIDEGKDETTKPNKETTKHFFSIKDKYY